LAPPHLQDNLVSGSYWIRDILVPSAPYGSHDADRLDYVPNRNTSIDHKDPATRQSTEPFVRPHAEQQRNKVPYVENKHPRCECSQEWLVGRFSYTSSDGPQTFLRPRRKTEKEVVLLLNTEVHVTAALITPSAHSPVSVYTGMRNVYQGCTG
jgi:hypothetical protein